MDINRDLITYTIEEKKNYGYECKAYYQDVMVCRCMIRVAGEVVDEFRFRGDKWTIQEWFTTEGYLHNGFGILTINELMVRLYQLHGMPTTVEYVWNGTNEYVHKWLEKNFNALPKSSQQVRKTNMDDDWESHIYLLDTQKVVDYFRFDGEYSLDENLNEYIKTSRGR